MAKPLRALIVEDSADDTSLMVHVLEQGGFDVMSYRVETGLEMEEALREGEWDVVLADYTLPSFSAPAALDLLKSMNPDLPFIVVSGTIGEDTAVVAMKAGANDYVLKGNLTRLVPAVERSLEEARLRLDRARSEETLRQTSQLLEALVNSSPHAITIVDANGFVLKWNPAAERLFGWTEAEAVDRLYPAVTENQRGEFLALVRSTLNGEVQVDVEAVRLRKDGSSVEVSISTAPLYDQSGKTFASMGIITDISAQKRLIRSLQDATATLQAIVSSSPAAIIALGNDGNVRMWNRAAERILGWKEREVLGKPPPVLKARFLTALAIGPEDEPQSAVVERMRRKRGGRIDVSISTSSLLDSDNEMVGLVAIVADISERVRIARELSDSVDRLRQVLQGTVHAMSKALELRDPYTAGHERRVAQLACEIAGEMGLSEDEIEGIRISSLLHDMGKIAVPAEILSKPGTISDGERELIKTHPQTGFDILRTVEFPWPVAETVLQHHERLDGSGYPRGITGDQILLPARVLAVADVVEAMCSHRPYRPALTVRQALREIAEKSRTFYDPSAVDACLKLFHRGNFKFD